MAAKDRAFGGGRRRGGLFWRARRARLEGARAEPTFSGAAGSAHFSLGFLLRQSAHAIEQEREALIRRGLSLARAVDRRRGGELTLIAHFVRLLIGLFWLYLALRLDREALSALAAGSALAGDLPVALAQALARLFLALGAIGVAAAFVGAWIVIGAGQGDNVALRRLAAGLGGEAAAIAKRFDEDLDRLRREMDDHARPADAVDDLSRMHLVALESAVFFSEIRFLTEPDRGAAARQFEAFLARFRARPAASFLAALMVFTVGAMWGFIFGFIRGLSLAPGVEPPIPEPSGIPDWAILASLGLALLYALAGRLVELFRAPLTMSAVWRAREEALDALRAAFVAGAGPRIEDVIRRIEDALAVYRARLPAESAAHAALPERPRFVEPAFAGAPPAFRVDAQAPFWKKIFTGAAQNAGAETMRGAGPRRAGG
jgi:hypothetical protein